VKIADEDISWSSEVEVYAVYNAASSTDLPEKLDGVPDLPEGENGLLG